MKVITEKTYPYLKDLMWGGELFKNPAYIKSIRKAWSYTRGGKVYADYQLGIDGADEQREDAFPALVHLSQEWPGYARDFRSRIDIVSLEFLKAVDETADSIRHCEDLCKNYLAGKSFKGTMLAPQGLYISYVMSYNENGSLDAEGMRLLELDKHGSVLILKDDTTLFVSDSWSLCRMNDDGNLLERKQYETLLDRCTDAMDYTTSLLENYFLFCHFAEVKTRYVAREGSREAKKLPADGEVSSCQLPLRRMYADYYTTIIRSEGFGVKGHFRMQACGRNHREHRLVYIKPFEKKGYTRRAKKEFAEKKRERYTCCP